MPASEGKSYLIIARDDLSGWVEARALANTTSAVVAQFLFQDIISRHGCPERFVMDGGPENKAVVKELTRRYKIRRTIVLVYHP